MRREKPAAPRRAAHAREQSTCPSRPSHAAVVGRQDRPFVIHGQRIRESTHSRSRPLARRRWSNKDGRLRRASMASLNNRSLSCSPLRARSILRSRLSSGSEHWTYRIQECRASVDNVSAVSALDITAADVSRYQRQLDGASGATINLKVATLRYCRADRNGQRRAAIRAIPDGTRLHLDLRSPDCFNAARGRS